MFYTINIVGYLIIGMFFSQRAEADWPDTGISVFSGYAAANLQTPQKNIPLLAFLPVSTRFTAVFRMPWIDFHLNLSSHYATVRHTQAGIVHAGVFNGQGGGGGFSLIFGGVTFQFSGESISSGTLSLKSELVSQVNGIVLRQSTLETYKGSSGSLQRIAIFGESKPGKKVGPIIMRFGISLEAMIMPFTQSTFQTSSNISSLGAKNFSSTSDPYTLSAAWGSILFGLLF